MQFVWKKGFIISPCQRIHVGYGTRASTPMCNKYHDAGIDTVCNSYQIIKEAGFDRSQSRPSNAEVYDLTLVFSFTSVNKNVEQMQQPLSDIAGNGRV